MKIKKSQLKQLIKEAFTNEMTDSQLIAQNRLDINDLYSQVRRVRGELEDSIDELTYRFSEYMSTGEKPSRFTDRSVVAAPPGRTSGPEEVTMSETNLMKLQLKKIIGEAYQEYEEMYAKNEASELRLLYNDFVDNLREEITWHTALIELDEQIRDKIESIEIRLNELAK